MENKDVIIIGGGISGLTAMHYIKKNKPQLSVALYEADKRLGGTIGTDKINGYSFDWGPNGFLDREPKTLKLCDEIGLTDSLERANENAQNRYILRGGKLRTVPMSPPKFLMSDILPLSGKLRVMFEPFAPKRPEGIDESIYDFVKRRIGRSAADYLVQPMVSGVYGGVAQKMSLKSCFPIMREMEDDYGSLFKAMIAKAKAAKKSGKKSGGPSGPGGWLTSFQGGLYKIIEQFEHLYKDDIYSGHAVQALSKNEVGFEIKFENGQTATAKQVVIATPANNASTITKSLSSKLSDSLGKIAYAPISVVCSGYDRKQIDNPLDGFGFLVPAKEKRHILGSIWTSSIFKERAPEGKVQFRTMIGGDGNHQSMELSDGQLLEQINQDLSQLLGIRGEPEQISIYRWQYGIPQYHIGHSDVLFKIESELGKIGQIYLTGNAYYGIGLNDCIKQSYKVAQSL